MKNFGRDQLRQAVLEISDVSMQNSLFETSFSTEKQFICWFCAKKFNEKDFCDHIEDHIHMLSPNVIFKEMNNIKNNIEIECKQAAGLKLMYDAIAYYFVLTDKEKKDYTNLKNFFNFK